MQTNTTDRCKWPLTVTDNDTQPQEMYSTHLDLDNLFHALSRSDRRQTLRYLDRQDTPVAVEELAAALAADQPARSTEQVTLTLTHQHLPLLENTNLVERTTQGRVIATDAAAAAIDVLDTVHYYFE
ncbi:DUF7344 domain-containing protein [Halomicrococcus sp. NG-SE-24]|uniref:DUF7344 domain-containing protein n=1 Tax=Halomicrococcus sp. NG-SE-24 TaxID=3436928 RepID=UPI003D95F27F